MREREPLPLCDVVALFRNGEILSMLGNRCKDDVDGDGDDVEGIEKDASFATVVESSSLVLGSCNVSPIASLFCSSDEGEGAIGIKNLAPTAGFTDGAEGDWNEFVNAPPLPLPPAPALLNVSTYLN